MLGQDLRHVVPHNVGVADDGGIVHHLIFFEKFCKYFLFNKISKLFLEKFDYLAHPVHNKDNMWNLSQSVSVRTQFFIATK